MKLLAAYCGGILLGMPVVLVDAAWKKMYYDYRPDGDKGTQKRNCGEYFQRTAGFLHTLVLPRGRLLLLTWSSSFLVVFKYHTSWDSVRLLSATYILFRRGQDFHCFFCCSQVACGLIVAGPPPWFHRAPPPLPSSPRLLYPASECPGQQDALPAGRGLRL